MLFCPFYPVDSSVLNDYTNHPFIIKRGADIRHTLHGSPQTTTIREFCAHIGDSSYNSCCSFVRGGDCEAIEQYVLQTWHVAIMRCKDTQNTSITKSFVPHKYVFR